MKTDLYAELHTVVTDYFFPGMSVTMAPDAQLLEHYLDSAQLFELVDLLERHFRIEFPGDCLTLENLSTLGAICQLLEGAGVPG